MRHSVAGAEATSGVACRSSSFDEQPENATVNKQKEINRFMGVSLVAYIAWIDALLFCGLIWVGGPDFLEIAGVHFDQPGVTDEDGALAKFGIVLPNCDLLVVDVSHGVLAERVDLQLAVAEFLLIFFEEVAGVIAQFGKNCVDGAAFAGAHVDKIVHGFETGHIINIFG